MTVATGMPSNCVLDIDDRFVDLVEIIDARASISLRIFVYEKLDANS